MSESPLSSPLEETVAIVGVGLIGGSLAAALMKRQVARRIIGVGRNAARIEAARVAGLLHDATTDLEAAVEQADLVVFCTPVDHVSPDVRRANSGLPEASRRLGGSPRSSQILFTDAGSVKEPICRELEDVKRFIGSHPIAGSHQQGFEAANPDLFDNRVCVITPVADSDESQVLRLERFWQAIGMRTVRMSPENHDRSLAMTSHLPHVVAASLAATLVDENRTLTGSGFRDTTRVAAGDPDLWTGILMNNAEYVVNGIDEIQQRLATFREALSAHDSIRIHELLKQGQLSRSALDNSLGIASDHR